METKNRMYWNMHPIYNKKQKEEIRDGEEKGVCADIYKNPCLSAEMMKSAKEALLRDACPVSVAFLIDEYTAKHIDKEKYLECMQNAEYVYNQINFAQRYGRKLQMYREKKEQDGALYGFTYGDIISSNIKTTLSDKAEIAVESFSDTKRHCTGNTVLACAGIKGMHEQILQKPEANVEDYKKDNNYPFTDNPFVRIYEDIVWNFPNLEYEKRFKDWALKREGRPYGGDDCLSAVRTSVMGAHMHSELGIGLYGLASTLTTHNSPEGIKGATVAMESVFLARHNISQKEIHEYMENIYKRNGFTDFSFETFRRYNMNPKNKNISQYVIPYSIICFCESNSFDEAIERALLGGENANAIACITGAIAGVYYGVDDKYREIVNGLKPEKIFDEALENMNTQEAYVFI